MVKSLFALASTVAVTMGITVGIIALSKWIGLMPDPPAAVCVCDGGDK